MIKKVDDDPYSNSDYADQMSIKLHVNRVEGMLSTLIQDFEEPLKDLKTVGEQLENLKNTQTQQNTNLNLNIMDEIQRLRQNMRELKSSEKQDMWYLKKQVSYSKDWDKLRLQQNALVVEDKVNETDKDVGFRSLYLQK